MRKITRKILSSFVFTALVLSAAASSLVKINASANGGEPAAATQENGLLLPNSYEEYLPLTSPAAVAVNESHTVIAEENFLYVYDRAEKEYTKYAHEISGSPQEIKSLQFCEDGNLYFAANSSGENFYRLNLNTFERTKIAEIACNSFVIHGKELYFANSAGTLYTSNLESEDAPKELLPENETNPNKPTLAFWNGELYFTDNGVQQILYKIKPYVGIPTPVATLNERVEYMTIESGVFAYSTSGGDFYAYSLSQISDENVYTEISNGGFSTLSSYDGMIYAVQPQKGIVKQYSTAEKNFTSFEICSSSPAQNRLHGATALCLFENELFFADDGNERISVYNVQEKTFETFVNATLPTSYLSSDGETLLAASASKAVLYDLSGENKGEVLGTFERFRKEIKGVASVYGKHYLITEGYAYQIAQNADTGEFELTERKKGCTSFVSPRLFTADVYGNLYVGAGSFVYRFSETDFMQAEKEGEEFSKNLPAAATQISLDYKRNLYALENGKIYKNGELTSLVDLTSTSYVYGGEGYAPQINAIALSIEENATYALCDGNYVVQTNELALPTVNTIAVNGVDEDVFSKESAVFSVVQTSEHALTVEFDLTLLNGAEHFPYLGLTRQTAALTALKIGECDEYNLLAVFDKEKKNYQTFLVLKEFCMEMSADEYKTEYSEDEQKTGYLTNAIALYKFPYLTELLTAGELPRDCKVTLLGEIDKLDFAYFHVAFETENGERKEGYVPQSYVNLFDGSPKESELYVVGETESNLDSVWRMAYLLLGFAAICILVDYLILRREKDEE